MAGKMKAQVFYEPLKMELKERDIPTPSDEQVLIKVKACGICGSDIAYYWGESPLETPDGKGPLVLGHEYSGEVAEVGAIPEKLGLFKPGDRVVLDPVQYCNACEICKRGYVNLCENKEVLGVSADGGFAEYSISHYTGLHKLPDNVSFEQGALTEPLACATYALQNASVNPGDFAVVIGPGAIGIMMAQLVKSAGAGKVVLVGTRDYRLEVGKAVGVETVINNKDTNSPYYVADLKEKIGEMTDEKFADVVLTPTGAISAMEMAFEISGRRSRIVFFGLPGADDKIGIPALDTIFWDKTIQFSWLAPFTWPTSLQALANGLVNVDPLVTHTIDLENLAQGLSDVRERKDNVMKAVVTM
ncbi:alcohol dehydrogenase catalytic domain-containing protein [Candidatus Poribacteria bacterium]|nr:alcohol dehydrogenase catalytic domain-containing protein [Candidatus Poribacteria bacterium]